MIRDDEIRIIKVIGFIETIMETRLIEEYHAKDYEDACSFIKKHPYEGMTWEIKPMIFSKNSFVLL